MNAAGPGLPVAAMRPMATPRAARTIAEVSLFLFFIQATVLAPGDIESALGFSTHDLGHRWWTVATFTLVHTGLWPLVVNLAVLLVFGSALERVWGTGEFVRYYIVCSLGAWIAHLTFASPEQLLIGSAGPAVGLVLAFAAQSVPEPPLRVGAVALSAGWVAVIGTAAVLSAGVLTATPEAAPLYLVHAGGLVAGWAYLRTAGSISLLRLRDAVSPVPDELDEGPPRAVPRARSRTPQHEDDIVLRSNAAVAREAATHQIPAPPPPRDPASLDRVLDKISQEGFASLTSDERTLLDEMSRRLRDQ